MRTPLRTLAAEIGISKSAVDKFHKLRSNPGKLWPKLRDWHMRTRQQSSSNEYQTPPDLLVSCALTLLDQVPNEWRAAALNELLAPLKKYTARVTTPEWIRMLDDLADPEKDA